MALNSRKTLWGACLWLLLLFPVMGANRANAEGMAWREYPLAAQITVQADFGQKNPPPVRYPVTLAAGEYIKIDLIAAGGTGYQWQLTNPQLDLVSHVVTVAGEPVEKTPGLTGGPVRTAYIYQAREAVSGEEILQFRLIQSWLREPVPAGAADIVITIQ